MRTAVVILNWNTKEYLERFLPGVIAEAERNAGTEMVVVDNGSTDGSAELVARKFPRVRVIALGENLGFTGGYNRAFEELEKDEFDLYLLLNSDIEVPEGWLRPLIGWMESHPECGACGPKLLSYYERDRFEYAGAAGGMLDAYGYPFCRGRAMKMTERDEGQYDEPKNVFWVTGACLMLRATLWHELGGLDARFFAHQEEIDLCWRMQLKGWKVSVVPQSFAYHLGGGTLPPESPWKMKLNHRNSLLLLDNNLQATYAIREPRRKAAGRAERRIRTRMLLDGVSAVIYFLEGKPSFFKAVIEAHREFRQMRGKGRVTYAMNGQIDGLYEGWIVPRAIFRGRKVFELIHKL